MDISSLLSPQDSASQSGSSTPGNAAASTASSAPSTAHSPQKNSRRGPSASTRAGMTSSPLSQQVLTTKYRSEPSPPSVSPPGGPNSGGGNGTPPATDLNASRQPSTPGIDTLADLASMQQHQPQRTNHNLIRNAETFENQLSPSTMNPLGGQVPHTTPPPRSSLDAISDGPREGRRTYLATSLNPNAQRQATELSAQIQENPHSYDAHVQFIRLLHAGFVNHVYPPASPDYQGDPWQYDLLRDMRAAREEMDKLFAMGEDLWAEWIQDESMLAQRSDERVAVMELCQRSVEEEYGSTKLWAIYGEWMLYLYNSAVGETTQSRWSEEDRLVGREVFTWQSVLEVWQRAAYATQWRIHDSHVIWDRFLDLCVQDLDRSPSPEKVDKVRDIFSARLLTPHATWDQTSQAFSGFVTKYYNRNYEKIMSDTSRNATNAKSEYAAREEFESRLRSAADSGDRSLEWSIYTEYIDWETSRIRRKRKDDQYRFDLVNSIYQRAVLRYPTDVNLWEDYAMFLIDETSHDSQSNLVMSTLDRATRHCPWSGTLWSQYLLSSEKNRLSFQRIANLKHKATSTGLLDAGGMEEVLKVHTTWCSFLRRWAFLPDSSDEDLDVAEVGIRSAIEDVQKLGEKKYGQLYQGDPQFRLERIYIRFLSESGSWDSARETFKGLVNRRGNSYEFWLTYYNWELISFSRFLQGEATAHAARRTLNPSYATAVLKQAIKRADLDWPEQIIKAYIAHCEDFEDSEELQLAILESRKAMKAATACRQREAAAAPASTPAVQQHVQSKVVIQTDKRKREDEIELNGMPINKKARQEEISLAIRDAELVTLRRDRENSTVIVKNLPHRITEHRVRQFFRHCGTIHSVKMLTGQDGNSESAIIEFASRDEALGAETKDQKLLDGNMIEVQIGSGSTLWVTNFPPTADEKYIRDLFRDYGEIVDVRFPSLKFNTHRRFCYVQFKDAAEARNATKLDGIKLGKYLTLVVKISDPSQKHERHGPTYEGREIHVSNIDWKASEDDLGEVFSKYGTIESVRIPKMVDHKSKGFGYIVFSTKDQANAALQMHKQEFRSRPLQVKLSTPAPVKRTSTTIVSRVGSSQSPLPETSGARGSSTDVEIPLGDRRDRTIALMNIPDTVNDARIQSLVEPYGKLIKIVLRPDHQGAIVEFADVHSAGKASLELEGQEITPGRRIHVGTMREMLEQSAERKGGRSKMSTKEQEKLTTPALLQHSASIRRPAQPGLKGGRRGGLGVKRGGATHFVSRNGPSKGKAENGALRAQSERPKKSNDDFRAMIQQT